MNEMINVDGKMESGIPLPQTDDEVEAYIKKFFDDWSAPMSGIFRAKRGLGMDVQEAFADTLKIISETR